MNLTIRIIKIRREKRLSQQALADLIGVSRSALAQWETELSRPSLESLKKMAEVLEISFEWLATGRGNQLVSVTEELKDDQLDSEISRHIPRLSVKRKKAVLDILREMH